MTLSLTFICEYMNLPENQAHVTHPENCRFRAAQFITPAIKEIEDEQILYIGNAVDISSLENTCDHPVFFTNRPLSQYDYVLIDEYYSLIDIFNRIIMIFNRYQTWYHLLNHYAITNAPIGRFLDCSVPIFENALFVVDSSYGVIALSNSPIMEEISANWHFMVQHGYMSVSSVVNMGKNNELNLINSTTKAQIIPRITLPNEYISKNIYVNNELQWHLFIPILLSEKHAYLLELADILGEILSHALKNNHLHPTHTINFYDHFLLDIILGKTQDIQSIQDQLKYLNWKPDDDYVVAAVSIDDITKNIIDRLITLLCDQMKGKVVLHKEYLIGIFRCRTENTDYFLGQLKVISQKINSPFGVSCVYHGFQNTNLAYQQAKFALSHHTTPPKAALYLYSHYFMEHLLTICHRDTNLLSFCHPTIFQILEYDHAHNTEYYNTLKYYLQYESSIAQTIQALNIHRNTLIHRLERIQDLFHLQVKRDAVTRRFHLLLSFQIIDFMERQ